MAFEIGWLESARKELVSREVVVNSCAFSKMLQKNVKGGDAHVFISGDGLFLQYADTNTIFCEKKTFIQQKTGIDMSDQELNAYRLTSMEEPTDEMLHAIMREAAEEAAASTNKALADYFKEISAMMQRRVAAL